MAVVTACVGAALAMSWSMSQAEDWPQFRGPKLDNVSASTDLYDKLAEGGPKVVWETNLPGNNNGWIFSSPVVSGGKVFVFSRKYEQDTTTKAAKVIDSPETLFCLDAASGKQLWKQDFEMHGPPSDRPGCWNTPVVDGDTIYARGPDGEIKALAVADGKVAWTWPKDPEDLKKLILGPKLDGKGGKPMRGNAIAAPSVVVGDILFVPEFGAYQCKFMGLDKKTGEVKWESPDYPSPASSAGCPVTMDLGGKKVVVTPGRVFDPVTGKQLTAVDPARKDQFLAWPGSFDWVPGASGNKVLVAGGQPLPKFPTTAEADAAKKEFKGAWDHTIGIRCVAFSAKDDGTVEGKQAWEFAERDDKFNRAFAGAMVAGDTAYMILGGTGGTRLVALSMADGKKLWQLDLKVVVEYTNTIYADGKIIWNRGGTLCVLPVSAKGPGEISAAQVCGGGISSPALADGLLYIRDDGGTVKCIDMRKPTAAAKLPAAPAATADWTKIDGPTGNNVSADKGLLAELPKDAPKVAWTAATDPGFTAPIVAGGKVIVVGQKNFGMKREKDGTLSKDKDGKPVRDLGNGYATGEGPATVYALNRADGKEAWKYAFKDAPPLTTQPQARVGKYIPPIVTPLVDGDKLYAMGGQNELACLNLAEGKPVWTLGVDALGTYDYRPGTTRLTMIGNTLVVSRTGSYQPFTLIGVDKATGVKQWVKNFPAARDAQAAPLIVRTPAGDCLAEITPVFLNLMAPDSTPLGALEAPSLPPVPDKDPAKPAQPRWENFTGNGATAVGSRVLVYRAGKTLDAYDVAAEGTGMTLKKAWSADIKSPGAGLLAVNDRVFQLAGGAVNAMALADGKPLWTGAVQGNPVGVILADGKLIMLTGAGEIIMVQADGAEFKLLGKTKIPDLEGVWSSPALSGGQLFVRDAAGTIKCVDLKGQ
jgi:outer membrane protein assembly factor BamB